MNGSHSQMSFYSLENSNGTESSNDSSNETLPSNVTIPVIDQLIEEIEENPQNLSSSRMMITLTPIEELSREDGIILIIYFIK